MTNVYGMLVALIFWGFVLGVIVIPLLIRSRDRKQLHETMRAYIARGEAVPEDFAAMLRRGTEDQTRSESVTGPGLEIFGLILLFLAAGVIGFGVIIALVLWGRGDLRDGMTAGPIIAGGGFVAGMLGAGLRAAGQYVTRRTDQAGAA